uniref:Secreted protein n=1 Tax=Setaria viridis TaxID=4556 RepID=A0A4V6DFA4_SETVI|nr:hypothetical protein SEVIR_1G061632v2 [Setaria viridis]
MRGFSCSMEIFISWAICARASTSLREGSILPWPVCEVMKYTQNDVGDLSIAHSSGGIIVNIPSTKHVAVLRPRYPPSVVPSSTH